MNKKIAAGDSMEIELVRRLADLLSETNLTEIEVEQDGLRIRVARGAAPASSVQAFAYPAAAAPPAAAPAHAAGAPSEPARGDVVKSPMVGTCYLQANPGAPPFIQVGAQVEQGQTLMIVEAMKTMNPIPSPRAGRVLEILVDDGQPVEFGEALIVLE
jgi:acetyl-CoA carboxylase biotin carboxyl carrier protein